MMLLAHCTTVKEPYINEIKPFKKYYVKNYVGFGEIVSDTGKVFRIEYNGDDHRIIGSWLLTRK